MYKLAQSTPDLSSMALGSTFQKRLGGVKEIEEAKGTARTLPSRAF
jgi:hypothetical protein